MHYPICCRALTENVLNQKNMKSKKAYGRGRINVSLHIFCIQLLLLIISDCRFIAVTQPIRYAKHKQGGKRVHIMIGLTWIISFAIAAPIALGMNYTDSRAETPKLCIFYNSEFLICSSLGSFYIPCIIMIFLYYRIFRAIHLRAKAQAMRMATKKVTSSQASTTHVIENKAAKAPIVVKPFNEKRGARLAHHNDTSQYLPPVAPPNNKKGLEVHVTDETVTYSNVITTLQTTTDTGEEEEEVLQNQGEAEGEGGGEEGGGRVREGGRVPRCRQLLIRERMRWG